MIYTRSVSGRMIASLLFVTTTALTSFTCRPAIAQSVQTQQKISFHIKEGSLSDALVSFSTQSHMLITSTAVSLNGRITQGLSGQFTATEALQQLLQGSGLSYVPAGNGALQIIAPPKTASIMLGPVRVAGVLQDRVPSTAMIGNLPPVLPGGEVARGGQLGMMGNRDIMDTPFNQTSYTDDFIKNRQIRNIRDVLKDDPSVRSTFTTGSP